jgi:hypothetical protein
MAVVIGEPTLAKFYLLTPKTYLSQYDPYGIYSVSCVNKQITTVVQKNSGTTTPANTFQNTTNSIMYQSFSCVPVLIDFALIVERYK